MYGKVIGIKKYFAEILKQFEWENPVNVHEDYEEVFHIVHPLWNKVIDSENYYKIPKKG